VLLGHHRERFPQEAALVGSAVPKRVLEFLASRNLARALLRQRGHGDVSINRGELGEPLWPAGSTGSVAHSGGMLVVAVADSARYRSLGLDLEPDQPLSEDVAAHVGSAEERALAPAARALFVAKEAFYKAHCGLHHRMLDFTDVLVQWRESGWTATELAPPKDATGPTKIDGSLTVAAGWLAALCVVEA
jgi:4'-phosphopantetheinyl transferase EntD